MTEPELLEIGTAEIIGNSLEVTISTPHHTKVYQYYLGDLASLLYFPETKELCFTYFDNSNVSFTNIISVENTEELNQ